MDECQETETEAFLTFLLSLLEPDIIKGKTLKIFLTSRPYDSISRILYSDHIKKIHIQRETVLPDIEKVLGVQLEDIQRQFGLSSIETQGLGGRLAQKSDGMFIWAVLTMKELGKSAIFATFGSLENLINELPRGLTELYDRAWLKLDHSHNENVGLARDILIWILLAARPLTLSELNMVLAMRPPRRMRVPGFHWSPDSSETLPTWFYIFFAPFVEIVIRKSGDDPSSDVHVSTVEALWSLGSIDNSIAIVRLVHQSAQAYLLQKSTEHFSGHLLRRVSFRKENGHELIARTCIAYLKRKELELEWIGPRRHNDKGLLEADDSTRDLIRKKLHQCVLLEYSSLYWSLHIRRSQVVEKKEQAIHHDLQDDTSSHALDFLCNYRRALGCAFQVSELTRYPERKSFWPCYSPLNDAAFLGCLAVVKRLVNIENADINSRDLVGSTPLMHVCMSTAHDDGLDSRVQIASLLLERNADPTAQDNLGKTGLHYAVSSGAQMARPVMVQLLLEKGADIAAKDEFGMTALHFAAEKGDGAVINLLLEKGANIAAKDDNGESALSLAAENGHVAVVRLLLEQEGIDLESKRNGGWTTLSAAANRGHEMVTQLLLEKGANAKARSNNGGSMLTCAAGSGNTAVVQLLIEEGADVGASTDMRVTALHIAAREGHEAVVQLLIEKGADTTATFLGGLTMLHAAALGGQEAMIRLLLEK